MSYKKEGLLFPKEKVNTNGKDHHCTSHSSKSSNKGKKTRKEMYILKAPICQIHILLYCTEITQHIYLFNNTFRSSLKSSWQQNIT